MLEFQEAWAALCCATFGRGSERILLDSVECDGTEDHLAECQELGDRMADGTNEMEGRVEVLHDGEWGTVCDNSWGMDDATVVCRMLGFGGAAEAPCCAHFGQGSGNILLDNVLYKGSKDNVGSCLYPDIGEHNCRYDEDERYRRFVLLEELPTEKEELKFYTTENGARYVTTPAVSMTQTLSAECWVFSSPRQPLPRPVKYGPGSGSIILDDVSCDGQEENLADCFEIRLVDGSNEYEGRVEVRHEGVWGTVCGDFWSIEDATVSDSCLQDARFRKGVGGALLCQIRLRLWQNLNECPIL
ncbi:scavenger receptor cysteine-rich domain-containing protein DMBT1-like [Diadema setosum]|uniref:scavenger receptor cysteine-rich domain-containing protein DMBT1-like n=1 Tax=Diadema setosum TaxID=31175 RepID=UPI003B3A6254